MSSRGIFATCLVAVFFSVLLVPLPSARYLLWAFTLWSIFLGSLFAFIGVAANMAGVLAFMYFGYLPRSRGASAKVLSFESSDETSTLIRDADNPEDFIRELHRIQEALSDLKSTLAFHRLADDQRHQYDRAFAELEVLIQQVSIPTKAERIAC
jgi:hypothetical protein